MSSSSWLGVLALSTFAFARPAAVQPFEAVEPHMGTLFRIKLYTASEREAKAAFRAAFDRIAALDGTLSDYLPDSELNRATREAAARDTPIGHDLFAVLARAQEVAAHTDGAFDVTVGALTRLWRDARKRGAPPENAAVERARERCGYGKLHLNRPLQTMRLDQPGMQLDLGGIAKGYAADEALQVLTDLGIDAALVAASGDLAFSNSPPGKTGWDIGIDSIDEAGAPFTRTLRLSNAAVSTSGDTEQHLDYQSRRLSHILDPHTGMALVGAPTVTVVARRGIDADPNATALTVLGCKGMAYSEKHPGLAVLMLVRDGARIQMQESTGFKRLRVQSEGSR